MPGPRPLIGSGPPGGWERDSGPLSLRDHPAGAERASRFPSARFGATSRPFCQAPGRRPPRLTGIRHDRGDERRAARGSAAPYAPDLRGRRGRVGRAVSATSASEGTTREARGTRAAVVCVRSHGFHDRGPPLASEETQLATGPHAAGPHFWLEAHDPGDRASTPRASPARWRGTGHAPRSKGDTFLSRREATRDGSRPPAAAWKRGLGLRGSPPARPARTAGSSPPPRPGPGTRGLRVTCARVEEAPATPGHVGPARGQVRSWWRGGRLGLGGGPRVPEAPRGRPPSLPPSPRPRPRAERARAATWPRPVRPSGAFPAGTPPGGLGATLRADAPRAPAGLEVRGAARGWQPGIGGARETRGCALGWRGRGLCPPSLRPPSAAHPPRPAHRNRGALCAETRAQPAARPGSAWLSPPASARTLALGGTAHPLLARSTRRGRLAGPLPLFPVGGVFLFCCLWTVLREMCNLKNSKIEKYKEKEERVVRSAGWGPRLSMFQSLLL